MLSEPVFGVDVQRSAGGCPAASPSAAHRSGDNRAGNLLKTRFAPRNSRAESRLADARPIGDRRPGWFAESDRDASKPPGDHRAQAARWTGSRRKRPGSGWCVSRAHWSAALSSEQSCGSPFRGMRARGSRCPPPVCAVSRARGESAHSRPHLLTTHVTWSEAILARRFSCRRWQHRIVKSASRGCHPGLRAARHWFAAVCMDKRIEGTATDWFALTLLSGVL